MALKPLDTYPAGGVDSRSNPIVEPPDRCLEVHDFWPQQDGSYRLRDGYTLYAQGLQGGVPIHSVVSIVSQGPVVEDFSTTTTAPITAPGVQNVKVAAINGMLDGGYAQIDTGANAEVVLIASIDDGGPGSPGFTGNFTKTHLSGVPVVGVAGPSAPLVVFWQGTVPYVLNPASGAVYAPLVKGAAIQSSSRFSYFYANGHLHAFNGTDAKWFDGFYWRDIGLPILTAAQAASIKVQTGLEAPSAAAVEAASLILVPSTPSAWVDSPGYAYFAFFDTSDNILAPCIEPLGGTTYPITGSVNQTLSITGLPTSSVSTAVGLLSLQPQGLPGAQFVVKNTLGGCSMANNGATTVTVTKTAHGLSAGNVIALQLAGGNLNVNWSSEGPFAVTVINSNEFSFQVPDASDFTGAVVVNVLLTLAFGATSYEFTTGFPALLNSQGTDQSENGVILLPYSNSSGVALIPASTIGGSQPGYQLYASIYNLVTAHVGNRITIGPRIANTSAAAFVLTGLPTFTDSEWVLLIGRTGDGAEVPYAVIDAYANWIYATSGQASLTITSSNIDGNSELPSRNYPPPGTLDCNYQYSLLPGGAAQNPPISGTFQFAWVESDHMCGNLAGSATIYRSGSALDMREGVFVGLPEQSWDPADIETFPTNEPVLAGHGYQQESWCMTAGDLAILMELNGETSWQGPYNTGIAGQHAWARGWQNLPFWITQEKQLATVSLGGWQQLAGMTSTANAGPILISGEYEAALLANIGEAYLSQTEISYIRKPNEMIEVLRIKCFDANGNPFTIIHDFSLRDEKSPYGQAYEEVFLGELATAFTQEAIRDQNQQPQVVAGGSDGNLYLLYSGGNDNGTEFTAQALRLINLGPDRKAAKFLEWYGDQKAQWYITKKLNIAFNVMQMENLCQNAPLEVQGEEGDNRWQVPIPNPEMVHAYILLQLTSHSVDGTTALNDPPHMPVESYGRVWMVSPQLGAARPR